MIPLGEPPPRRLMLWRLGRKTDGERDGRYAFANEAIVVAAPECTALRLDIWQDRQPVQLGGGAYVLAEVRLSVADRADGYEGKYWRRKINVDVGRNRGARHGGMA